MVASTIIKSNRVAYCRPEAYELFVEQLPVLHTCEGLLRAAVAISMHALDDVDPHHVEQRLRTLALRVRERSPSRRAAAILANMHAVLFEEEEYGGNLDQYYNALNSYLPAVLNSRRGLPVTLALIYKVVGMETAPVRAKIREFWSIVRSEVVGAQVPPEFAWR
jgi:hypothetical protein